MKFIVFWIGIGALLFLAAGTDVVTAVLGGLIGAMILSAVFGA